MIMRYLSAPCDPCHVVYVQVSALGGDGGTVLGLHLVVLAASPGDVVPVVVDVACFLLPSPVSSALAVTPTRWNLIQRDRVLGGKRVWPSNAAVPSVSSNVLVVLRTDN